MVSDKDDRNDTAGPDIGARIRSLADKDDIRQLVARYCFAIDDHDFETLTNCFAAASSYRSVDGVIDVHGRDAIDAYFRKRMQRLGPSNHVTHDHLITLDPDDPDRATGHLNSHAEVVVDGALMLTSLRYRDSYMRENGRWCFSERLMSFFYYCRAADYPAVLASHHRKRLGGVRQAADHPESLPGWRGIRPPDAGD